MRNLTIQRKRAFAACLVTTRVYIEDAVAGTVDIEGVPCRLLGKIKNGQTATFAVGDEAVRLFASGVASRSTHSYDEYDLPAGTEDVSLSGQNIPNPAIGNPFRFDGVTDERLLQRRRAVARSRRGGMLLLCATLAMLVAIGVICLWFVHPTDRPKTFHDGGVEITLTTAFTAYHDTDFAAYYETEDGVSVFAVCDRPERIPSLTDADLGEYTLTVLGMYKDMNASPLTAVGGQPCFTFRTLEGENRTPFTYLLVMYEDDGCFWRVWFGCPTGLYEDMYPSFATWAESVSFTHDAK